MNTPTLKLAMLASAVLGGALLSSCRVSQPNPDHCFHADGDQTCAELDPSLPFCVSPECGSEPYGCVAELPETDCHSPCGADSTAAQDVSCVEVSDGGNTDTDTGSETDSSEGDCEINSDCPDDAAFCLFGTCTPCDGTPDPNGACATLTSGEAPVCLDGDCVGCTQDDLDLCIDTQQACDVDANICVACTDHSQCPGGAACDVALGSCLPADAVWHVDGDGGHDFLTISEAMAEIGDGSGTIIIHQKNFGQEYEEDISFAGPRTLALLAVPGQNPRLAGAAVALDISDGARVYARGLTVYGDISIRVASGSYLDLDSCQLGAVASAALSIDDSVLLMRNTTSRNSDQISSRALLVTGDSSIDITYSTLVSGTSYNAVACSGTLAPGSIIRNSMIGDLADTNTFVCPDVIMQNNGLEQFDWNSWKEGNTLIDPILPEWFHDYADADLHLTDQAPVQLSTVAVWQAGDPLVDIDGDPRPAVDGMPDFVGADRLP